MLVTPSSRSHRLGILVGGVCTTLSEHRKNTTLQGHYCATTWPQHVARDEKSHHVHRRARHSQHHEAGQADSSNLLRVSPPLRGCLASLAGRLGQRTSKGRERGENSPLFCQPRKLPQRPGLLPLREPQQTGRKPRTKREAWPGQRRLPRAIALEHCRQSGCAACSRGAANRCTSMKYARPSPHVRKRTPATTARK